ncbi:MAG: YjjG family noncanonical pyrimidine nucleotidase [Clostridia bacterium]|nr:YjjG family noncanonical pyrimidine nucleotidase [Clostridia bacterium]
MKDIFLVDADDTVLDFHGASSLALRFAFKRSDLPWKEEYAAAFKVCNDGLWESLERKELTRKQLIERRFPLFLSQLGFVQADGAAFNGYYLKFLSENPIFVDGAEAFLKKLGEMGRVYIVTNGTAWIQRSRFERARLWERIEDAFISDLVGADKPSRFYTDHVLSHIPDFRKDRAVWIGDSLSADIKAANDAAIESIWFNRGNKPLTGKAKPDHIAMSFAEILDILQSLNGK